MTRILVIVPAYNESMNIGKVVAEIQDTAQSMPELSTDIVVINDASTDNTAEVAEASGATVLHLPFNLGIGGAVQTGFRYALENDFDVAVQIDGDGQHDPKYLKDLLTPLMAGSCDVVIGSRFMNAAQEGFRSTFMRRIGIKIFQAINSMIIRQRITDNTSGFRAYNRRAIRLLADEYPTDYPEPEAVIVLGLRGFRITEVPVVMRERQGGKSSIGSTASVYYMSKVLLAIVVNIFKDTGRRG